jgi:hypothetical protein
VSFLSEGSNLKVQKVLESGMCRRLVELLGHPSVRVKSPVLRAVGNLVTGTDLQVSVAASLVRLAPAGSSRLRQAPAGS